MSKVMRTIDAKSFIIGVLLTIVIGSAMGQQSGMSLDEIYGLGTGRSTRARSTSTKKITNSIPSGYEVVGVDNGTIYYWKR